MEEILKTVLLEYDKSSFVIDMVRHSNGQVYISLKQMIHGDNDAIQEQKIRINPSILDDLIEVLTCFHAELCCECKGLGSKKYFSREKKEELKRRYLIGVSIRDLTIQFRLPQHIVEQILTNSGIEIVSNDIRNYRPIKWKKRRKGGANRIG